MYSRFCNLFFAISPNVSWQKAEGLVHQCSGTPRKQFLNLKIILSLSRSDYAGLGLGSSGKVLCLCLPRTDSEIRTKVMITSLIAKLRQVIKCLLISSTTSGTGACIPQQVQYDPSLWRREKASIRVPMLNIDRCVFE